MFDQMDNDAIKVVLEAQIEASRLAHDFVDTEHLLLGIIALPGISTGKLMTAFNIALADARLKVIEISSIGTQGTNNQISLPLTRLAEQVLERSWQMAKSCSQINIYPEHILMTLLDEKQGNTSTILESLVSDSSGLREQCMRLCKEVSERKIEEATESRLLTDTEQREIFCRSFLVELKDIMRYSLSKGDALMLTANIIGKVLAVSRCLFICDLPTRQGERRYEYWDHRTVQSCAELQWPGTESPLVSKTLLYLELTLHDKDHDVDPILLDELRFIKAKSFFAVSLQFDSKSHGVLILQQCARHRILDIKEINFLQEITNIVAKEIAT